MEKGCPQCVFSTLKYLCYLPIQLRQSFCQQMAGHFFINFKPMSMRLTAFGNPRFLEWFIQTLHRGRNSSKELKLYSALIPQSSSQDDDNCIMIKIGVQADARFLFLTFRPRRCFMPFRPRPHSSRAKSRTLWSHFPPPVFFSSIDKSGNQKLKNSSPTLLRFGQELYLRDRIFFPSPLSSPSSSLKSLARLINSLLPLHLRFPAVTFLESLKPEKAQKTTTIDVEKEDRGGQTRSPYFHGRRIRD